MKYVQIEFKTDLFAKMETLMLVALGLLKNEDHNKVDNYVLI